MMATHNKSPAKLIERKSCCLSACCIYILVLLIEFRQSFMEMYWVDNYSMHFKHMFLLADFENLTKFLLCRIVPNLAISKILLRENNKVRILQV